MCEDLLQQTGTLPKLVEELNWFLTRSVKTFTANVNKVLFRMFLLSVLFVRQVHCHKTILNIVTYLRMIIRSGSVMNPPRSRVRLRPEHNDFPHRKSFIIEWP